MKHCEPMALQGSPAAKTSQIERWSADLRTPRGLRLAVFVSTALLSVAWTLLAGKDLNWDALNYHLYAGFSALNDRFAQDFFAAGPPAYFNPYAHVPLYLMIRANLPSVVIGSVLACVHCTILWLTFELAVALNRRAGGSIEPSIVVLSVLFALLNPVLLQQIGSSFNDISTGILVLGGWVALANAFHSRSQRLIAVAGALMGAAAALKLTNAIFIVAALPVVILVSQTISKRIRLVIIFGAACSLAFLIVAGPWAWRLWETFGNPIFPMFNQVFRSPDFISDPLKHYRFIPDSVMAALLRPFEMALPVRAIHTEVRAPDIRYAALFSLPLVFAVTFIVRARRGELSSVTQAGKHPPGTYTDRALGASALGFVTAWLLWLYSSGNSRYFLPMACLAGVLLASFLARIFVGMKRVFVYVVAIVVAAQSFQLLLAGEQRWNQSTWAGPWISASIPEPLLSTPYFYLSLGVQSNSFLALFLPQGSGFMNISGIYPLGPGAPGGDRASKLIAENLERLRVIGRIDYISSDGAPLPIKAAALDGPLARFGLHVVPSDCQYFRLNFGWDVIEITKPGDVRSGPRGFGYLYTCRVVPGGDVAAYEEQARQKDLVFTRVENACPNLFQPRGLLAEQSGSLWLKFYFNTDIKVWINNGWVKFLDPLRGGDPVVIGLESDWLRAPQQLNCGKEATSLSHLR